VTENNGATYSMIKFWAVEKKYSRDHLIMKKERRKEGKEMSSVYD